MTKRQQVLELIRVAAHDGDEQKAMRLYIENRISFVAYQEARKKGYAQRK